MLAQLFEEQQSSQEGFCAVVGFLIFHLNSK
jgi:hypothetical protein